MTLILIYFKGLFIYTMKLFFMFYGISENILLNFDLYNLR